MTEDQSTDKFIFQITVIGFVLVVAIISDSVDAKLFKKKIFKKKWFPKLFGLPSTIGLNHGLNKIPAPYEDHPRIVEIVKHVPVIQKVEVIKPIEIIKTVNVPGRIKSENVSKLNNFDKTFFSQSKL